MGVGVPLSGGGEATIGPDGGECSTAEADSAGFFSLPGVITAGGKENELEARGAWLGLRGGGGAGAWTLARRLEDRDLVESNDDRRIDESASSCWTVLLSDRPCGCRLGGGAGFLAAGGAGAIACDAFGGVGGLTGMTMFNPGCKPGSGTLPAASQSNTFSATTSAGDLSGAGGSGLLTSEGVLGLCLEGDVTGAEPLRVGLALFAPVLASLPAAGLINFPCRELGGGGFFLRILGAGCKLDWEPPLISPCRSSSPSCSDVSCDVRGVSCTVCSASDMDWRDVDEASVMLAPSPPTDGAVPAGGAGCGGVACGGPELPACPVNNSRLKASTSRVFLAPAAAPDDCDVSAAPTSKSLSVFWNGFGGGPCGVRVWASSY